MVVSLSREKKSMAKKDGFERRSGYYQTIAKYFIELRGAPFILSSKELDIIRRWEEIGIPLRVVLEGIRGRFEKRSYGQGKRRRPLDYCHPFVMRAFDLYKDRRIGQKKANAFKGEKERKKKILLEIEKFLSDLPKELYPLRPIYSKLHKELSGGNATDEVLEKAEETIERLIEENISTARTETITAEIISEFGKIGGDKFNHIFRIKALKAEREKHKIPHVSPFYY
jgi:hypothetical protein